MRLTGFFTGKKRQEVDAFQLVGFRSRQGEGGGGGVELNHGLVVHAGLEVARPGNEERDTDAAFERVPLGTTGADRCANR